MQLILAALGSKIGIGVLVGLSTIIALWAYGNRKDAEGYDRCKMEWKAAEDAAQKTGRDAASGADSDVRGGVRDDFDSDDN